VLATTKLVGFDECASERDHFVVVHPPLAASVLTADLRRPHTRHGIAKFHSHRPMSTSQIAPGRFPARRVHTKDTQQHGEYGQTEYGGLPVKYRIFVIVLCLNVIHLCALSR
jgi:hypothetical protein